MRSKTPIYDVTAAAITSKNFHLITIEPYKIQFYWLKRKPFNISLVEINESKYFIGWNWRKLQPIKKLATLTTLFYPLSEILLENLNNLLFLKILLRWLIWLLKFWWDRLPWNCGKWWCNLLCHYIRSDTRFPKIKPMFQRLSHPK